MKHAPLLLLIAASASCDDPLASTPAQTSGDAGPVWNDASLSGERDGATPGAPDGGERPVPAQPDAAPEADAAMPLPKAADPCGEDLGFVGGSLEPDVGEPNPTPLGELAPEAPGSWGVLEQDETIPLRAETRDAAGYAIEIGEGSLAATVYAPSEDGGATLAKGPFPLLLGAPGFGATYRDYASSFRHFASHGFVVVGLQTRATPTEAQHDKEALETSQVIDWLLAESPYREHIDATKIAASGHSKGGKVSFFAAAIDARIDIVFGWDPSNAGGPPCGIVDDAACNALPVAPNCLAQKAGVRQAEGVLQYSRAESFVFGVPPDPSLNPNPEHNAIHFYRGAPSPASLVMFQGGHAAWLSDGLSSVLGSADVIRITRAVQTAKLLELFYGADASAYLPPSGTYLTQQGGIITQVATK